MINVTWAHTKNFPRTIQITLFIQNLLMGKIDLTFLKMQLPKWQKMMYYHIIQKCQQNHENLTQQYDHYTFFFVWSEWYIYLYRCPTKNPISIVLLYSILTCTLLTGCHIRIYWKLNYYYLPTQEHSLIQLQKFRLHCAAYCF